MGERRFRPGRRPIQGAFVIRILRARNWPDPEPTDRDVLDALQDWGLPRDRGLISSIDYLGLTDEHDESGAYYGWEIRVEGAQR